MSQNSKSLAFPLVMVLLVIALGFAVAGSFFTAEKKRMECKLRSDIQILYRSLGEEYARHALFLFEEEGGATLGEVEYLCALSEGSFENGEQVTFLYREFLRILAERENVPSPNQPRSQELHSGGSVFSYCTAMLRTCNALKFAEDDLRFDQADPAATAILVKGIDKDLSAYAPGKTVR